VYIILLTYVRPIAEIEPHLAAHRDFLDRHYAAGDLVCSGPRDPRTGGVILARFESDDEVQRFIASDPFYGANVAEYQTIRFNPTRFDPAFEAFTAPR
jgi:uncharacterized protein YciI